MGIGIIVSVVLHLSMLLLAVLVVPILDTKLDLQPSVSIDMVDIGPLASPNLGEPSPPPPASAQQAPAQQAPAQPAPAQLKPAPSKPLPPQPPVPPPPDPDPEAETPDPVKPPLKPQPLKPQPPKPQPPVVKPPVVQKPAPTPPDKKPESDPLASLLSRVAGLAKKQPPQPQPSPDAPSGNGRVTGASTAPTFGDRLSGPETDALVSQIGHCWNVDPGKIKTGDNIVDILIEVGPDRRVISAKIDEKHKPRMANDPPYRATAEAALRAVLNPRCQPLALPPERFDTWRNIRFTFDPKDMY
ncbi:MAG: cell envelope integrity protein TolA [Rhodospirillaceae bacterium]